MAPVGARAVVLQCVLYCGHRCGLPRSLRLDFSHRTSKVGPSGLGKHRSKYGSRPDLFGYVVMVAVAGSTSPGVPLCWVVSCHSGSFHWRNHGDRAPLWPEPTHRPTLFQPDRWRPRDLFAHAADHGHDLFGAWLGLAPTG